MINSQCSVIHTGINQSPTCWELSCVEALLYRIKLLHVIVSISQGIIPTINYTLLVARCLVVVRMVPAQSIDLVATEEREVQGQVQRQLSIRKTWRISAEQGYTYYSQ